MEAGANRVEEMEQTEFMEAGADRGGGISINNTVCEKLFFIVICFRGTINTQNFLKGMLSAKRVVTTELCLSSTKGTIKIST